LDWQRIAVADVEGSMNEVAQKKTMAKGSAKSRERWYVLVVRAGFESIVVQKLRQVGFETYLPEYHPANRGDSSKFLFPGYVFCRFALKQQRSVTLVTGALYILGDQAPMPFEDGEFASLRIATNSGLKMRVFPSSRRSNRVRVLHGPLSGLDGFVLARTGKRYFAMSVRPLKQALAFNLKDCPTQLIHKTPVRSTPGLQKDHRLHGRYSSPD